MRYCILELHLFKEMLLLFKQSRDTRTTHRTMSTEWNPLVRVLCLCSRPNACVWNWEYCPGRRNHEERRMCEDCERKLQAVSSKTVTLSPSTTTTQNIHAPGKEWPPEEKGSINDRPTQSPDLNRTKICRINWRPRFMPKDHQILTSLGDFLANDCRLLSIKRDTQLTISW